MPQNTAFCQSPETPPLKSGRRFFCLNLLCVAIKIDRTQLFTVDVWRSQNFKNCCQAFPSIGIPSTPRLHLVSARYRRQKTSFTLRQRPTGASCNWQVIRCGRLAAKRIWARPGYMFLLFLWGRTTNIGMTYLGRLSIASFADQLNTKRNTVQTR
jgi:hypothetical protein